MRWCRIRVRIKRYGSSGAPRGTVLFTASWRKGQLWPTAAAFIWFADDGGDGILTGGDIGVIDSLRGLPGKTALLKRLVDAAQHGA